MPIEHGDVAAPVADEAGALQFPGDLRNAFAAYPEHAGDQFMRHDQLFARQAIKRQQQPAAKLLLDRVVPIASRRLRHLGHQCLGVAQQQALQRAAAFEFLLQQVAAQSIRMAGMLCTTAELGVVFPPMNSEMPTMPSLPTPADSAEAPDSMT
jgi:hypothetical protein